jgi:hypothetical protein
VRKPYNNFVRDGDIDPKELTGTTDITASVKDKLAFTRSKIELALKVVNSTNRPDISPAYARLGSFNEWLAIYRGLADVEPDSIYDLCIIGAEKTGELEELGVTKLVDIPDSFKLSAKQALQVKAAKQGQPIIDQTNIKKFLNSLVFPLYFFDYETLASIVPYFDGMKPYKQYPFQYSLHILDSPEAEPRHVEFLQRDNNSPLQPLSEALKSQIGETGSVITWNMSFEKGCNTLIGSLLPTYEDFYEKLNERIVDLMLPFSNGWYVDKGFKGSSSIKSVLPVLVPELSYKVLGIQEGGAAQRLWMEAVLDGKRDGEKETILNNLTTYCALDTMAMVKIYDFLTSL